MEIKTERFQAIHATREIQSKEEASLKSQDPRLPATAIAQLQEEAESSNLANLQAQTVLNAAKDHVKDNGQLPSHICEGLNILYRQLRTKWERPQTPIDEWDYNTSSEWADDEEYKELWPTPPKTPPQGDENHPPSSSVCGEHPGLGWELNAPGTVMYYRFLIPDPTTNRCVVAPFLTYFIQRERPEVSATYGKGYPIHTRLLQPLPVDYFVPSMTPEQIGLLDAQSPCANAINKVLNTYFPYHISAAVRQYQYFKETQYAIQRTIKHLQNKEQRYLEKAVGLLSELENANFLGRLMAHGDVIIEDLGSKDPHSCGEYLSRTRYFEGDITQSALDPKVNPFRSSRTPTDDDDPRLNPTTEREQRIADVWWQAHPECERECLRPAHPSLLTVTVTSAERRVTFAGTAPSTTLPTTRATIVSKVEISPLPTPTSFPFFPRTVLDYSISCTIRFLFPFAYQYDVLIRASCAQTLLVSDCTSDRDYPLSCFVSETLYLYEDAPHHLIILLSSCTLRVLPLIDCFVSCFTFRVPPTIKPPSDIRRSSIRRL